ncbi:hypothetical protein [Aeoliella sp. SH292]|uniref:hypothetical protein n=1 Tax=Aeoliella sp. SH292 TaxID=3454464 RepID=UPI003F9E4BF6
MRRVPIFRRVAVVCSSLTLLLGFVAMKAGALSGDVSDSSPQPTTVRMHGTKSAPVHFNDGSLVTSDGSPVEIPKSMKEAARLTDDIHAYSSKSAVPLVRPAELKAPTSNAAKMAPLAPPMLMPSTKRAEVFDSSFPAKPASATPAAPVVTVPSSKSMAPAIDFSPPASKVAAPQTMKGKGD